MSDLVGNPEDRFSHNDLVCCETFYSIAIEPRHEKTNNLVSDQVRHKLSCTTTEDGKRPEISDLVEGLYYLYSENKGADQFRGYREADLRLCFRICKTLVFS